MKSTPAKGRNPQKIEEIKEDSEESIGSSDNEIATIGKRQRNDDTDSLPNKRPKMTI